MIQKWGFYTVQVVLPDISRHQAKNRPKKEYYTPRYMVVLTVHIILVVPQINRKRLCTFKAVFIHRPRSRGRDIVITMSGRADVRLWFVSGRYLWNR